MRKAILLLWLAWHVAGCQTNQAKLELLVNEPPAKNISQQFAVMDSLEKYGDADSLFTGDIRSGNALFVGEANDRKFAVWVMPDDMLVLFQCPPGAQWEATDTVMDNECYSFVRCLDLNGDGQKDIAVSCISGSAANTLNKVFLFDNSSGMFMRNEHYDLVNVDYDVAQKFVISSSLAGIVHCQEKQRYKITGDSLTLDLGISCCPNNQTNGNILTIRFYKRVGSNEVTTKKITGKATELWPLFEKSLWNTGSY
jgi:hypothetical protein